MRWSGPALAGERLVVVAPHPDDEVLAAGGLIRWSAHHGTAVVVVAVTDGEASHQRSTRITADHLRAVRARERTEALARLGAPEVTVRYLGAADQGCEAQVEAIADGVAAIIEPQDLVVTVSEHDRHPDHVATSLATRRAAAGTVATVWEAPTWALVHGTARRPTSVLELDECGWLAKQHAVAAFRSQLEPLGPEPVDGPVVHEHELAAMVTRCEQFRAVQV